MSHFRDKIEAASIKAAQLSLMVTIQQAVADALSIEMLKDAFRKKYRQSKNGEVEVEKSQER